MAQGAQIIALDRGSRGNRFLFRTQKETLIRTIVGRWRGEAQRGVNIGGTDVLPGENFFPQGEQNGLGGGDGLRRTVEDEAVAAIDDQDAKSLFKAVEIAVMGAVKR